MKVSRRDVARRNRPGFIDGRFRGEVEAHYRGPRSLEAAVGSGVSIRGLEPRTTPIPRTSRVRSSAREKSASRYFPQSGAECSLAHQKEQCASARSAVLPSDATQQACDSLITFLNFFRRPRGPQRLELKFSVRLRRAQRIRSVRQPRWRPCGKSECAVLRVSREQATGAVRLRALEWPGHRAACLSRFGQWGLRRMVWALPAIIAAAILFAEIAGASASANRSGKNF